VTPAEYISVRDKVRPFIQSHLPGLRKFAQTLVAECDGTRNLTNVRFHVQNLRTAALRIRDLLIETGIQEYETTNSVSEYPVLTTVKNRIAAIPDVTNLNQKTQRDALRAAAVDIANT